MGSTGIWKDHAVLGSRRYHTYGFSDNSRMEVAYSDGVMAVSFLNCLEK